MHRAMLALGANLNAPHQLIRQAIEELEGLSACKIVLVSDLYRSVPIGGPTGQDEFCNATLEIETELAAEALLVAIHAIEARLGRVRTERWASRVIDIDLILYEQIVHIQPSLLLPHPRFSVRRFVLEPAVQMGTTMIDPVSGLSCSQLLECHERDHETIKMVGWSTGDIESLTRALAEDVDLEPRIDNKRLISNENGNKPAQFTVISDAVFESKVISPGTEAYNHIVSSPWCVIEQAGLGFDQATNRLKRDVHAALVASSALHCPLHRLDTTEPL